MSDTTTIETRFLKNLWDDQEAEKLKNSPLELLRYRSNHKGENPSWKSYEKLRNVIEKTMFTKTEDLLPVISFGKKPTTDAETKHHEFVTRMVEKGYTERQIQRIVEWYMRVQKSS